MWVPFENRDQLEPFLDAATELHRPLLEQLTAGERPFFFHHWATQLNRSDCYLLEHGNRPVALAAYPRVADKHYERWQVKSLAVHPGFDGPLDLPRELGEGAAFTAPADAFATKAGFAVQNAVVKTEQITFARTIDDPAGTVSESEWSFGVPAPEQLDAIIALFSCRDRPAPGSDAYLDYYLPILTSSILRIHSLGKGYCFFAAERGKDEPVAAAYYSGWELPLAGVACSLVDDILVLPAYRGRGIAAQLQEYAYARLREAGIRWITGNIDPDNRSSLRQAKRVGRRPWTLNLRILPA